MEGPKQKGDFFSELWFKKNNREHSISEQQEASNLSDLYIYIYMFYR